MSELRAFTAAVAAAVGPADAFAALCRLAARTVGHTLFTALSLDGERSEVRRIYSNQPAAYPTSGVKPVPENAWTDQVLRRREPFVANTIAAIAEVFPDHELIAALGCGSIVNIPIVVGGEVIGIINCLNEAGFYTPERFAASEELRLPGIACFLFHQHHLDNGGR